MIPRQQNFCSQTQKNRDVQYESPISSSCAKKIAAFLYFEANFKPLFFLDLKFRKFETVRSLIASDSKNTKNHTKFSLHGTS